LQTDRVVPRYGSNRECRPPDHARFGRHRSGAVSHASNEKTGTQLMIPVEVHLSLNHVPLVGLALGLVFFVSGLARSATAAVLAGLRVFVAMGIVVLPVVGSGLMSRTALANATWLDASAVSSHQLAGILSLVVLVTLAALSGAMLWVSRQTSTLPRWGRTTILVLALVGFGTCLWTAYLGGRLRHSELGLTEVGANDGAERTSPGA
jgi:uncharacterized membrane protein